MNANQAIKKNYPRVTLLLSFFPFKNIESKAQAANACLFLNAVAPVAAAPLTPTIFL